MGTDLVPGLDGYYWEVTPSGNTALSGTNYPFGPSAGGCPTGTTWDTTGYINTKPVLTVGGTSGQKYTINIGVRGVVGTRCYTGRHGSHDGGRETQRPEQHLVRRRQTVRRQHLEHDGDPRLAEGCGECSSPTPATTSTS